MTATNMSLHDAIELQDVCQLANETDVSLCALQVKLAEAIASWNRLGRAFDAVEIAWYNRLNDLSEYVTKTLNTRYGCND